MKHMLPSQLCTDGETEDRDLKVHTGRVRRSQNSDLGMGTSPVLTCVARLPDYPVLGTSSLPEP